ncbi:hypothetical protein LR48_Vigan02g093200 [Vigna angularis]|uniref:Uncharacterized protein n=1 Tax=Phaseolus angularis TaxID=3914 RepID=A0A0L9TWI9_PHAAN|nr:hypothetical protein LR48_Vigan02g093200 [Vigna angularis]
MTGQGSEHPDKGKGVVRPRKRQRQAPKYVLRVPARLPTTVAGSTSSVGPPPTPTVQPPTPAVDPTPTPAVDPTPTPTVHPSTTPATDPLPPLFFNCYHPPLHDRPWIESYGKGFIPSRVASQAITRSIKQQFLSPWPTWGTIPDDDKKPFWQRFQVQWKPEHESQIHRNFHMKASHRLSEMFRDARNAGQRPYWLGTSSGPGGHVDEVFAHTHVRKGTNQFVDERSRKTHEAFSTRLSQVRSEHESAPTPDDANNAEDDIPSRGGTLKLQPSSSTTSPDEVVLRLMQALQQRVQEITDLRAEFTNFKALVMRGFPATSQDELVIPPTPPQPSSSPAVPQQPSSVQPTAVQPSIPEQDDEDHSDDNYVQY